MQRDVPRVIVAPPTFGKSHVALDYAQTVFGFESVHWMDCSSPCFLRDLDARIIAQFFFDIPDAPSLVVFESLPCLDLKRQTLFAQVVQDLVGASIEVLCTAVPASDPSPYLEGCVRLGAKDLLLNAEECRACDLLELGVDKPRRLLDWRLYERIPSVAWADGDAFGSLLPHLLREDLDPDTLLAVFVGLVLGEGSLEDLGLFHSWEFEGMGFLEENYPYLGITLKEGRFKAFGFSAEEIAAAFGPRMGEVLQAASLPQADPLVCALADLLVSRDACDRACELLCALGGVASRSRWLEQAGARLFDAGCLLPASRLYASLAERRVSNPVALGLDEAVRRMMLGDADGALRIAQKVAGFGSATPFDKIRSLFVLARCAPEADACEAAAYLERFGKLVCSRTSVVPGYREAALLVLGMESGSPAEESLADDSLVSSCAFLASLAAKRSESLSAAISACRHELRYPRVPRQASLLGAAYLIDQLSEALVEEDPSSSGAGAEELGDAVLCEDCTAKEVAGFLSYLLKSVSSRAQGRCTLPELLVVRGVESLRNLEAVPLAYLPAKAWSLVSAAEQDLLNQVAESEFGHASGARLSFDQGRLDNAAENSLLMGARAAPRLTVNLFGGMQIRVGEQPVDPKRIKRQKVRTLLALLVLARGREYSRDRLVAILWPESSLEAGRKNFYSAWSYLRSALRDSKGECPYLVRQQNGVRLNPSLLESDVIAFDDLCHAMLFERPSYAGWDRLLARIRDEFADDLLPSETENHVIMRYREACRCKMVDSMTTAAVRLMDAGCVHEGLCFAREAVERDPLREDANIALIRALLASGQKSAAVSAYFACRNLLASELGTSPSAALEELYKRAVGPSAQAEASRSGGKKRMVPRGKGSGRATAAEER